MPVPAEHAGRYVYHFTDLTNLDNVLTHGLLSCNEQRRLGLTHKSIAESSIQERRSRMPVTCGPRGVVHDYVPLYFGKTSPMLLKQVSAKNVDQPLIVYFVFPIQLVERDDVVFTNAAANTVVPPTFFSDPSDLGQLNWTVIDSRRWASEVATKQARMAEVLVHRSLDPRAAAYLVVWNDELERQVREIYARLRRTPPPIGRSTAADGGYYFTNFRAELPDDMRNHSLASGPIFTKGDYKESLAKVLANRGRQAAARFANVYDLLAALRVDLAALPETSELIGLESNNEMHTETVGNHTLRVVDECRELFASAPLGPAEQQLVELAAYLHDIGTGPKSRWSRCAGGKQQVDPDHPIKSTKMLERILTQEIRTITDDEARVLCKLVCYHDLYGDIVGRDRRREQLADIAENERDLEMLITIGRADMTSVRETWGVVGDAQATELRNWVLQQWRGG